MAPSIKISYKNFRQIYGRWWCFTLQNVCIHCIKKSNQSWLKPNLTLTISHKPADLIDVQLHVCYVNMLLCFDIWFCFVNLHTDGGNKESFIHSFIHYMCIQLYYLVYNVQNNTHRVHLFYVLAYNYIISCTTCKTTHIVYVCFMYEHTTILPCVQRVQQHKSSTSVLCISIQLYYLVYNV